MRIFRLNRFKTLVWLISLFTLSGCAATTVKSTVLHPARYHEASRYRQLAVLPFDGNAGDTASYQAEAALAGASVSGAPYFNLVDRRQLSAVISEMKLGHSALVEPGSMAKVGRLSGARGILGGMATENSAENRYREERSECSEYETLTDKNGKKSQGRCIRWNRWQVICVKRSVSVSLVPRLVDVETAQVVYSRNIQRSRNSSGCLDNSNPLAVAELVRLSWAELIDDFRNDMAPYQSAVEIEISEDDAGLASKDALDKFSQGVAFAKGERLDRACELWAEIAGYASSAPFLAYNLGVCAEVAGQYDRAESFYRQADRQMKEPDVQIGKGLERVRSARAEQMILKEQLKR